MAKETMKEKIVRLEAELEHEKKLNNEIFEKLQVVETKLLKKNISEIEENPLYAQIQQEMERYKLLFEEYKSLYEKSESKRKQEHGNNVQLHKEIQKLNIEQEKLASENTELKKTKEKVHNERGAGRKSSITAEKKQTIINDRKLGMTFQQLSKKYGYSVGTIHKLIIENNNI